MAIFRRKDRWYVDVHINGKRIRKAVGPDRKTAELVEKDLLVKAAKREYLGIFEDKAIPFSEFAKEFLDYYESTRAKNSFNRVLSIFQAHLIPSFGETTLPNITAKLIADYFARRAKVANVATVNRERCALRTMMQKAVEWGYLKVNPAIGFKIQKEHPQTPQHLEQDEVGRLLEAAKSGPPYLYPLMTTAVMTGLRKAELFNLTWSDIDFRNKLLWVRNKDGFHSKNYEERAIPMTDELVQILRRCPCHFRSPYIFFGPNGERRVSIKKPLKAAAKRAGVELSGLHQLRHTFASHLVMAGVDLPTVQRLLGHKTLTMVLRYTHLSGGHLKEAVAKLSFAKPETVVTESVSS